MQVAQQDLAFAEAVSQRFAPGTALGSARAAAEEGYATALVAIADRFNNSKASAIAAESFMNLSPWNYYQQVHTSVFVDTSQHHACGTLQMQIDLFVPVAEPRATLADSIKAWKCSCQLLHSISPQMYSQHYNLIGLLCSQGCYETMQPKLRTL